MEEFSPDEVKINTASFYGEEQNQEQNRTTKIEEATFEEGTSEEITQFDLK